jgi:HPt (histidine-containing phosphotransfer) domain-containing protein
METQKIIDLSYLRQLANGSDEFMQTMISIFIAETPSALDNMEKSWERSDWPAIKAMAHKMKPSFGFMGIASMKEVIAELETDAERGEYPEVIKEKIARIKTVCTAAIVELRGELKKYQKSASRI